MGVGCEFDVRDRGHGNPIEFPQPGGEFGRSTGDISGAPAARMTYCTPLTIAISSSCVHGLVRVAVCARRILTSAGSTAVAV